MYYVYDDDESALCKGSSLASGHWLATARMGNIITLSTRRADARMYRGGFCMKSPSHPNVGYGGCPLNVVDQSYLTFLVERTGIGRLGAA